MNFRLASLAAAFLATIITSAWADVLVVKHDKLQITDLIEQSISVLYTNHGGDQAFDVATGDIVSFKSGADTAWLLPVLNGNADNHPLPSGQCDVLIYKADTDYLTPLQFSHVLLGETRDDQCVGFNRPLVVTLGLSAMEAPVLNGCLRPTSAPRPGAAITSGAAPMQKENPSHCSHPILRKSVVRCRKVSSRESRHLMHKFATKRKLFQAVSELP
ncbi:MULTISPECIES: hypothetical protein [Paraburkholderia]|uniref:hypothetical protein n=1 Tax=Paraburkholderia TaxID=1822464 RepID=UPI0006D48155|nr:MULTISPECIES: hypothetical protein [Paraburkholderia]AMV48751.1 hypothetical protein ATN79_49815 [Paraburkholderia caribensis]CAG9236073.1 conserved exported hypothetical protein [Paraburkholderia caribensis]